MVKFVYKAKRRVNGRLKIARLYRGRYKLEGDLKNTEVPLRTSDKQVAEKKLSAIFREKEWERAGISIPKRLKERGLNR